MSRNDEIASLKIDRGDERSRPALAWIVVAGLLAAVAAVTGWWWISRTSVVEVRTAVAREIRADRHATVLNASGYVTARRQATVSSKVTGRVVEVLIEEGMQVAEGQLLARLDDSNARVNLRLAEAQVEAARTAVAETRVRLHEAGLELQRARTLHERRITSTAELDAAEAQVASLEARLVQQDQDIEVAARRVALWRQEIADRQIRAPFAGVVVTKNAQPGEMISPMSAGGSFTRTGIGTIVDMDSLEIEVDVNESYINRVVPEQPVEAVLDAYPDWPIPARVIAIVPTADRQRATVRVRIGFEELDPRVLPDMGVKVAFREGEVESEVRTAIAVPASAVREDGDREVVFVVREDGSVERRAVSVGATQDQEVLVAAGVAAGDRVVIEGPPDLEDGVVVREAQRP